LPLFLIQFDTNYFSYAFVATCQGGAANHSTINDDYSTNSLLACISCHVYI
jgi:hypothetical protein